jgi:predicted transposase YbfD/YdcC
MLLALLCDAPRGQKDLVRLARRLTQRQRRALGIRPNADGSFPAPTQSTFSRCLSGLDPQRLNQVLLDIQAQVRGAPPADELIVLDGKEPRHGPGHAILTAVTVPSQHYLGSALVDTKTNEIPVARDLFGDLDLAGRTVRLDALHTQDETARQLVQEHGAHYLLTVKDNQPHLRENIEKKVPVPPTGLSPRPPTPTCARTVEWNKGVRESRTLCRRAVSPEDVGFPWAAQAARLTRQATGRADETVALLTDLEPRHLAAATWLQHDRRGWDIETGLHARLDVSLLEDLCRIRTPRSLWVLGMLRRLVVSLYVEWRAAQPKGHQKTVTDFHTVLGEENLAPAFRFLTAKRPSLKNPHA